MRLAINRKVWEERKVILVSEGFGAVKDWPFELSIFVLGELLPVAVGGGEEAFGEAQVLEFGVGGGSQTVFVECPYFRFGHADDDGRVAGDDELAVLLGHFVHKEGEGELALRGEGGFGFVDEIESAGMDAGFDEFQKAFSVREVVEVPAVAAIDGSLVAFPVSAHAVVVLEVFDLAV